MVLRCSNSRTMWRAVRYLAHFESFLVLEWDVVRYNSGQAHPPLQIWKISNDLLAPVFYLQMSVLSNVWICIVSFSFLLFSDDPYRWQWIHIGCCERLFVQKFLWFIWLYLCVILQQLSCTSCSRAHWIYRRTTQLSLVLLETLAQAPPTGERRTH